MGRTDGAATGRIENVPPICADGAATGRIDNAPPMRTGGVQLDNIKIGMASLGCPKNQVDGEAMLGMLRALGCQITPDADSADLIIVNTCGFIDTAKKESIDVILEMAEKKKSGRCRAIVATGCLTERYRESFRAELPEVDAILGTGEYGRICEVVRALAAAKGLTSGTDSDAVKTGNEPLVAGRPVFECDASQRLGHLNAGRVLTGAPGAVYIKIAEGCDNRCAYCIIPQIRGPYISRSASDIISEAERLAAQAKLAHAAGSAAAERLAAQAELAHAAGSAAYGNAQARGGIEATLVAQDTTAYGFANARQKTTELCELIDKLSSIDGINWIRLLYGYPDRVDAMLIKKFAEGGKLLRYLDLPVQHASDGVLRAMGRRYTGDDLYELIGALRREAPGMVLRTTLITGFPGETDGDFEKLLEFVKWAAFERLGVFTYSREEGTAAAKIAGSVPKKIAKARRAALLKVQAGITARYETSRIGHEYEALIESGPSPAPGGAIFFTARTYAEAPQIDGAVRVYSNVDRACGAVFPGCFVNIKITGADAAGLTGEVTT